MGHYCYDTIIVTATTSEWACIEIILKSGAIKLAESETLTIGHGRITCENKYRSGIDEHALLDLSRMFPCAVFCWQSEIEDYPPQVHYYVSGKACTLHTALHAREKSVQRENRRFLKKALQADEAFPFLSRFEPSIQDMLKGIPVFQTMPPNLPPVKQISCGDFHVSALTEDGQIISWGIIPYSQDNLIPFNRVPIQISCGRYHTAILFEDGTVQVLGTLCRYPKEIGTPSGVRNLTPEYPLYLELVHTDTLDRFENCKNVSVGDELYLKKVTALNEIEVFTKSGGSLGLLKNTKNAPIKSIIPHIKKLNACVVNRSEGFRKNTSGLVVCVENKDKMDFTPVSIQNTSHWKNIVRIYSMFDGVFGMDVEGCLFMDGYCGDYECRTVEKELTR